MTSTTDVSETFGEPDCARQLDVACRELADELKEVDIDRLSLSTYNGTYLSRHRERAPHGLARYADVLQRAIEATPSSIGPDELVLVEYGGGVGILSLLARQLGFGTVIYNDIYETSVKEAEAIGRSLNLEADHYVAGELDDIRRTLMVGNLSADVLVSYDVIEHIYDVEDFLVRQQLISDASLTFAHGSGANTRNPMIRAYLARQAKRIEHVDRQRTPAHKERDTLRSYRTIRADYIESWFSDHQLSVSDEVIQALVRATRGHVFESIDSSLSQFVASGRLPSAASDDNTCDPNTGNWAEHLLDLDRLADVLVASGYSVEIFSGLWGKDSRVARNLLNRTADCVATVVPQFRFAVSPYYIIRGRSGERFAGA